MGRRLPTTCSNFVTNSSCGTAAPLSESSVDEIAHGLIECHDIELPLDESTIAARRYIALEPADVQKPSRSGSAP